MSQSITDRVEATLALEDFIRAGEKLAATAIGNLQPNPIQNTVNWAKGVLNTYKNGDRRKDDIPGLCDRRGGPPLV